MAEPAIGIFDFVRTSRIREIEVGSTRDEVLTQFGEPPTWGPMTRKLRTWKTAVIWRYGNVEFTFMNDDVVSRMAIFPFEDAELKTQIHFLDREILGLDIDDMRVRLHREELPTRSICSGERETIEVLKTKIVYENNRLILIASV